jgi:hypothetical protein
MFYIVPVKEDQLGDPRALGHAEGQLNLPPPPPPLHQTADREHSSGPASRAKAGIFWSPDFGETTTCRITSTALQDWGSFKTQEK